MREIKFRAWDNEQKRMFYLTGEETLHVGLNGWGMTRYAPPDHQNLAVGTWSESESILCQFTGLRDKNGKEIYEGDIIREGDGPGGTAIGTIENVNGDTVVKFLPGTIPDDWNHEYYPVFGKMDNAVVIGNVYENRGLLDKVR